MTNTAINRRSFFRNILAPALAVAVVATAATATTNVSIAEAGSPSYNKGFKTGMSTGRKHGYTDGYKGAYKAFYVDEMINGGGSAMVAMNNTNGGMNWAEYRAGYKIGYRRGYKAGYASGQRDGGDDGRADAQDWKASLRDEMLNCMNNGTCD